MDKTKALNLEQKLDHLLNPLHVYCYMRNAGIKHFYAKKLGILYEKTFYKVYTNLKRFKYNKSNIYIIGNKINRGD